MGRDKSFDIFILFDAAIIFGSFIFGYYFRTNVPYFGARVLPPLAVYAKMAALAAIGWVVILKSYGLYRHDDFPEFLIIALRLIQGTFWAVVLILSGTFFYRSVEFSRVVVGMGVIVSFFYLYFLRLFCWQAGAFFSSATGLLIAGSRETGARLADRLIRHQIPYKVKGFLDTSGNEVLSELKMRLNSGEITGMVVTERLPEEKLSKMLDLARGNQVQVFYLPEYYQVSRSTASFVSMAGLPLLTFIMPPLERFGNRALKRVIDLVLSLAAVILLLPLLLVIALLIKLTSAGPVFFRQKRVGFAGQTFSFIKFRTMAEDAGGKSWTEEGDDRLTGFGGFLRRHNLDELPQFFNVLLGQMSLVGPRPIAVDDVQYFQMSYFERRYTVKPGITGWAQVHGLRGGHLLPEERLAYDLFYVENWNIWLDLVIILATPFSFRNAR